MTTAKKKTPGKKTAGAKKVVRRAVSAKSEATYDALMYSQRSDAKGLQFVLFHAPAGEIARWADVDRLGPDNPTAAQRPLRQLKVAKVARYLRSNATNAIPTSVVLALDSAAVRFVPASAGATCGSLTVICANGQPKPALIIDGQHRVFGALAFSSGIELSVVALLGADDAERAFQFVVINNSASKVSKDHIKSLSLTFDPDKLNRRLIESAGVSISMSDDKYDDLAILDRTEPFEGLIDWPTNQKGFIAVSALESALMETRARAGHLNIETFEMDVFQQIWSKIRELRKNLWRPFLAKETAPSRLLQKASIFALTSFILDVMTAKVRSQDSPIDFTDRVTLDELVERLVNRIPVEFWTADWTAKELDTTTGRKILADALETVDSNVRYGKAWYVNVSIIDPALLHGQSYGAPKKRSGKTS